MKKTLLVWVIVCATSMLIFGQTDFGIKGGINLSNLAVDKDQIDKTNMKIGFTAGAFAQISLSNRDWLMIQPEALYTLKGAKYETGNMEVKANLHYIDVPVLAVLRLFNSPLTIHAGPQFSLLLKPQYKYTSVLFGENTILDDDKDNYKKWDIGFSGGLGLEIENLIIEARVSRGFRNVEEKRTILNQLIEANDTKNFGFRATVGFLF